MNYTKYVYLIASQNRLVILNKKISDSDYIFLFSSTGNDMESVSNQCNTFCAGVIFGQKVSTISIVNQLEEFII